MSTSESGKNAPHTPGADFRTILPSEAQAVPAGFPEPAVLARMANEFFTALPSSEAFLTDAQRSAAGPGTAEAMGAARNPAAFVTLPGSAMSSALVSPTPV